MALFSLPLLAIAAVLLLLFLALAFLVRPRPVHIPIRNRHVLVTGGSSGIGLAVASAAAAASASRVSILARSESKLSAAADLIRRPGTEVVTLAADVTDMGAVAGALEQSGDVDVLVCNQGVFVPRELEKQPIEEVRNMIEINVMGTFNVIKSALPGMKKRARETGLPGSIAIVSSQAGQVGVYGYTAYSASKFALRGLAEALQHEVIADNIHISLVFPPDTDTPGFAEERRSRPDLTNLIAESSGVMKVEDVARKTLDGIKRGQFIIPCNFEGLMLSIATAGLSPQRSGLMALVEVLGAGLMRFLGLIFQWNWFSIIEKWNSKKHA